MALPDPSASQSMQVPPPSTVRFAFVSISKLLPLRTFAVGHAGAAPATPAPDSKNTDAPASAATRAASSGPRRPARVPSEYADGRLIVRNLFTWSHPLALARGSHGVQHCNGFISLSLPGRL